jgi:hypothetical protein
MCSVHNRYNCHKKTEKLTLLLFEGVTQQLINLLMIYRQAAAGLPHTADEASHGTLRFRLLYTGGGMSSPIHSRSANKQSF